MYVIYIIATFAKLSVSRIRCDRCPHVLRISIFVFGSAEDVFVNSILCRLLRLQMFCDQFPLFNQNLEGCLLHSPQLSPGGRYGRRSLKHKFATRLMHMQSRDAV